MATAGLAKAAWLLSTTLCPALAIAAPTPALVAQHGAGITVDGDLSDWGADTRWQRLSQHDAALGAMPEPGDAAAEVAVRYDRGNARLYVAMRVRDDVVLTAPQETDLPHGLGGNPDGVLLYVDPGHRATLSETIELSFVERPIAADDAVLPDDVVEIARTVTAEGMTAEWRIELPSLFAYRGLAWEAGGADRTIGFDAIYFDRDSATDGSILMLAPGPHDGVDNRRLGDLFLLQEPRPLAKLSGRVAWPASLSSIASAPDSVRLTAVGSPDLTVHARAQDDGRFELLAPIGDYRVHAMDSRVLAGDAKTETVTLTGNGLELDQALIAPAPPLDPDRLISEAMREYGVHTVGVAWLKDGQVIYRRSFGTRRDGEPAGPDTRFRVASITKAITTMTVLDMARSGDWDLDGPLYEYWMDPDIADDPRSRRLTTRMVLRHLTGLPNWRGSEPLGFIDDPGAHQGYSGEAFELLRKAIEAATGKSLETLARERIFAPAGMAATSYRWSDDDAALFAGEFHASGAAVDHYTGDEINAAANLLSTPQDLLRFAQWTMTWARENPGLFAELTRANAPELLPEDHAGWARHGLGWLVHDDDDLLVLEHSGGQQGIRTQLVVVPERGEAVAILTNGTAGWPLIRMIFDASMNRDGSLARTSRHLFSDLDD